MQKFLISLILVISWDTYAQKNVVKNDSLHFTKICFNGLCIGDPIKNMIGLFGKPSGIKYYDGTGEMDDDGIPSNYYYYIDKKNNKGLGVDERIDKQLKGKVFNFSMNDKYDMKDIVKIGDDVSVLKVVFPHSYLKSVNAKKIDKKGNGSIYIKIYGHLKGYESITILIIEINYGKVSSIYTQDENSI